MIFILTVADKRMTCARTQVVTFRTRKPVTLASTQSITKIIY